MKKLVSLVAVLIALLSLFSVQATAAMHFGAGYQLEEKDFTIESEGGGAFDFNSTSSFESPIGSGKIYFGFDLTNSVSFEASMFRSATSTIYTQSIDGRLDPFELPVGTPSEGSEYFTITNFGWLGNPVMVSSNFAADSKVRYRTSGGNAEFVYNFPTGWQKKKVVRFKGFIGYMRSEGVTTTDFEANGSSYANGSKIIITGDYSKTVTTNETLYYENNVKVISGYDPVKRTFTYYENIGSINIFGKRFGLFEERTKEEIVNYAPKYKEINVDGVIEDTDEFVFNDSLALIIPIDPTGVNGSVTSSIKQTQEIEGGYLGLSMTCDIVENLDMELAVRHMVAGHVQNTINGPGFSSSIEDDEPDITMADLIFTAHFIKGIDLKAIYSKAFADYKLGNEKFDDETGKISLVLDYRF